MEMAINILEWLEMQKRSEINQAIKEIAVLSGKH